jgi:hypothetical protein
MNKLKLNDGSETCEREVIINEVKCFYENLYSKRNLADSNISDFVNNIPVLSRDEAEALEGEISLEEASMALKNMPNDKSPGSDGFTADFFKVFWRQLGALVVRSLNEGFRKGEMSNTQKEGIIICIPKPERPKDELKNWRPISLLNVVYKIGSASIANRIKTVLPSLINEDQTGFIKNRYIGDNIRLIYDVINYVTTKNAPGLLLCLDFEKAFDTLDWNFLHKTLQAFGFGEDICNWVLSFYHNIKSSVSINGHISNWFHVCRGCRQGDPISPYLFVLCIEILGIMIRENDNIKGININGTEHKLSQYADDTEILLEGDKKSFEETIKTIDKFGSASGLYLNTGKTSAIWLGSKRNSPVKYMQHLGVDWNPTKFKILGIWFTNDLKDCIDINLREKFLEVRKLYKTWLKRQITPIGRVAILKSLILSKLIYLWILLPNPPDHVIDLIQKTVFEFVWNRKRDRISRSIAVKSISEGGLGIPNIRKYIAALKLSWVKKLSSSNHKWKSIICSVFPYAEKLQYLGSALPSHTNKINAFWKDVFKAYFELGQHTKIENSKQFLAEPIFFNNNIRVDRQSVINDYLLDRGIKQIKDFVHPDGQFLSCDEFKTKHNVNIIFLTYVGYINAIKVYQKHLNIVIDNDISLLDTALHLILMSTEKGARKYYDMLLNDLKRPNCCSKWEEKLEITVNWKNVFQRLQGIKEIKLKWFQLRLVHRILGTNVVLHSMGVVPHNLCSFCDEERESILHIFCSCKHVKHFWNNFKEALFDSGIVNNEFVWSDCLILFSQDITVLRPQTFDYAITVAKFFIYKCKCEKVLPRFGDFKRYFKANYDVQKFIAMKNLDVRFDDNWSAWKQILDVHV